MAQLREFPPDSTPHAAILTTGARERSRAPAARQLSSNHLPRICALGLLGLCLTVSTPAAVPKLRVGVERDSPPLAFIGKDGQPAGFTPELLAEMARVGGFEVELIPDWWIHNTAAFSNGTIDVLGNVLITSERRATMDFSIGHAKTHGVAYFRPRQGPVERIADFRGKTIGVVAGTMLHRDLVNHSEWGARVVGFPKLEPLLDAIRRGECDAALSTSFLNLKVVNELGLTKSFVEDLVYVYHFATHDTGDETIDLLNEAIARLKQNGTYDRLYAKWIGPIEPRQIHLVDLRPYFVPLGAILTATAAVLFCRWRSNVKTARAKVALERSKLELEQAHRQLSTVFNSTSVGIVFADAVTGTFKPNAAACALFGFSEAELSRIAYPEITHPDDRQREAELFAELNSGKRSSYEIEKRGLRKDRSEFWAHVAVTSVCDSKGLLVGYVAVFNDITDRRRAQLALEQFKDELEIQVAARTADLAARTREVEGLLRALPDTVLICDRAGTIQSCRPPHVRSPQPFITQGTEQTFEVCNSDMVIAIAQAASMAMTPDRETVILEQPARELPGKSIWVEACATLIDRDRMVVLVRDISDRKQVELEIRANLERAHELAELRSRFLAVASHEFRTPLTTAISGLDLLVNHAARLSAEKRGVLIERIRRSHRRLTDIMDDVIAVGRADSGRVKVSLQEIDLGDFLEDLIREAEDCDLHRHPFTFRREGLDRRVPTDPKLLHLIVTNLLTNATRYSPPGSTVSVALATGRDYFEITVSDQGIGIPECDWEHLFEPFVRGSNVGNIVGTGLGLSIIKRYTEILRGRVALRPSPVGTTFCITMPVSVAPAAGAQANASAERTAGHVAAAPAGPVAS